MLDLTPLPGDLDPIETAPVEELRALQLQRLQWSVRHAYDQGEAAGQLPVGHVVGKMRRIVDHRPAR